mgnify:CR=1 FL=1
MILIFLGFIVLGIALKETIILVFKYIVLFLYLAIWWSVNKIIFKKFSISLQTGFILVITGTFFFLIFILYFFALG